MSITPTNEPRKERLEEGDKKRDGKKRKGGKVEFSLQEGVNG